MADSSNNQVAIAAFSFGMVVNAATGAAFLYLKGHTSSLLRDGLRLVLVVFLATSALWAQTDFITTLIGVQSAMGCQVAIVFASIFDQLARVSLQQATVWAVGHHDRVTPAESLAAQGAILIRFVLGGVFVGLQRPQLDTICVTSTSVLQFGIVLLVADLLFTAAIMARFISLGLLRDMRQKTADSSRSKAALWTIVGLAIWTGMSAPLMLGVKSIDVITRTAVPATGLSILIGVLTLFKDSLTPAKEQPTNPTEDATQPGTHSARNLVSRDLSTADSALAASRYEEVKNEALASFRAASQLTTSQLKTVPGAPRANLPLISNPYTGQATTGMGGVPVQGQFFPPMRSQTLPVSMEANREQRQPRLTRKGTKLIISNPVLSEASEQKVMTKIPTVDLATAAQNEKRRVETAPVLAPSVSLAYRTELRPPPIPPKAVKRRSLISSEETMASSSVYGAAAKTAYEPQTKDNSTAKTSSSMLSPGVEELRRRSPRQSPTDAPQPKSLSQQTQADRSRKGESRFPARLDSLQQTRISAPKPLPKAPSPPSVVNFSLPAEPRKTVLPLKQQSIKSSVQPSGQTIASFLVNASTKPGLPSNPLASRMKILGSKQGLSQQQTVMFMKNIEYNDPDVVKSVVDSAKDKSVMSPGRLLRAVSMVHRPRPIPRLPEIDRAIFPAEGSPNLHEHKRSLSNGPSRKMSILFPLVANPNMLLPFPPLPKSAGVLAGSRLGDTRSMTWDEKMDMFYPESRGTNSTTTLRRRSRSVPEMPVLPLTLSREELEAGSPRSGTHQTDGSARTSVATQSISILLEDFPRPQDTGSSLKAKSVASQSTNRELKPVSAKAPMQRSSSKKASDRRSSPILPAEDLNMFSPYSEARSREDEVSVNWGSIHSPVTIVNLQKARAVDVPAVPQVHLPQDGAEVAAGKASPHDRGHDMGSSTVMAEPSVDDGVESSQGLQAGELKFSQTMTESENGWHRRVGEECPSFSDRGQVERPRKVPPPAPLLLTRTNMVPMAAQTESAPLESPEHALAIIQEQLRKLEEFGRGSPSNDRGERMTLLANLETELGQQEDQWQGLRDTLLVRDSQSTLGATPSLDLLLHGSGGPSFATPLGEGLLQAASSTAQVPRYFLPEQAIGNVGHPSSQASDPTNGYTSPQRMAASFRSELPTVPGNNEGVQVVSSLPISPASLKKSAGNECEGARSVHPDPAKTLWRPVSSDAVVSAATHAFLWTPVATAVVETESDQIPLGLTRRRVRKDLDPLGIESSCLWSKPVDGRRFSHHYLWRPALHPVSGRDATTEVEAKLELESVKEEEEVSKPAARRPPRRSKRITLLPDILESPKPIPDKRGTLGIFQFPWGEMSDMPSVPVRPLTAMAMAGTMTTGQGRGLPMVEGVEGGYGNGNGTTPTSFFDDYEAGEDGDSDYGSFSDSEGNDDSDDDGFDEEVLWEIASLLKPSQERGGGDSVFFPTKGAPHTRGEGSGTTDAGSGVEFVRRDDPEARRVITTNFASSETESAAAAAADLRTPPPPPRTEATPATPRTPRAASASPRSDGPPHATVTVTATATATPMATGQDPGRLDGFWQGREKPDAQAGTRGTRAVGTDEANLESATDAARDQSPKAELIQAGGGGSGGGGGGVDSISSVGPVPRCHLAGAPMTTVSSAHETGLPQRLQTHGTRTSASRPGPVAGGPAAGPVVDPPGTTHTGIFTGTHTGIFAGTHTGTHTGTTHTTHTTANPPSPHPPGATWTLNAVKTGSELAPRQASAHPVSSRVLLPSAAVSADASLSSSAAADEIVFIQTAPSAISATPSNSSISSLPDSSPSNSLNAPSPLSQLLPVLPQFIVPQQQNLLRNANHSSLVGSMAMLWSPPTATILRPSKGLSQPDASIWNSYLPINSTARSVPRKLELAPLETATLWTQSPPKTPEAPSPDGLWALQKPQELMTALHGMWTLPQVIEPVSYGLAQPDAELWASYLPAKDEAPRVKQRAAEVAAIESQSMWTKPTKAIPTINDGFLWTASKTVDASANSSSSPLTSGLWTPTPAVVEDEEPVGLFSLSHRRSDFRTSALSPAALHTQRKPRAPQQAFADFGLAHLWNQAPLWDAAAAAAAVKEQTEIDELVLEGLFNLEHRRTNFRTTTEAPAALDTKRKPRISQEPLPTLTSDSLWSVRDQAPAPVMLDWLAISSTKPRSSSVASSSADSEYLDAVTSVASSVSSDDVSTKLSHRVDATPAQWQDALQEALASSRDQDQDLDVSASPSSAYQLWSLSDDMTDPAADLVDDKSMWKPSSSPPANRYLELTPTPGALDDAQLRASSETLRRGGQLAPRPPPPVFHGASHSAFVPSVSETPRDFSAQGLWASDPATMAAATAGATLQEERAWLDKSLRSGLSLVSLW
ncbi:hypothetical protein AK830_g3963 [Neonectria ditissima]|uniref:Uncharacterized protein n=1 Tax=Neonectria ditissima TaxID=78410 RepID=A0A0N8H7S2_9HYPO|nr:hypothetical protein AK830_g3963 [Neonectria ditissima]